MFLLLRHVGSTTNCKTTADPCLSSTYRTLNGENDYTRCVAFHNPDEVYLSDAQLPDGWYRATSGAGEDMPTTAPEYGFCQTQSPIWFPGILK